MYNAYKYLQHYGYKVSNFEVPDIDSRYYYNYIKTIGSKIHTDLNNDIKYAIQAIFDKGITVWHYRSSVEFDFKEINNYYYENIEMALE
jgi:hypothetical protein